MSSRDWLARVERALGQEQIIPWTPVFTFSLDSPLFFGLDPASPRTAIGSVLMAPGVGSAAIAAIENAGGTGRLAVVEHITVVVEVATTTLFLSRVAEGQVGGAPTADRQFIDFRESTVRKPVATMEGSNLLAGSFLGDVMARDLELPAGTPFVIPGPFIISPGTGLAVGHGEADSSLRTWWRWTEFALTQA